MIIKSTFFLMLVSLFSCNANYIPEKRESLAQQFGNKYANLVELQELVSLIKTDVPFKVPPFFGISDTEVKSFLKSIMAEDQNVLSLIIKKWELFKEHQLPEEQTLTTLAKEDLASMRAILLAAFKSNEFRFFNDDRAKEFEKFINSTHEHNRLLMVRSTGREDTGELANAGGNESIASVQPTVRTITQAMGVVVASYFSEKSLNQRIAGNDARLFDEPFMPVLLQEMIGEQEGAIPVSGVFYSQEAEGRTPGVTAIQATYGHNEAVVNGLVPVDTYYIGPTGIIHPLIRIKNRRLAPKKEGSGLEFVANDLKMQRIPCLKLIYLHALKEAARVIQNHYGYPVDCEFIVLNNTIYLVQARPLEEPKTVPSYVKQEYIDLLQANDKSSVFVIGSAGGTVRTIADSKEVIIAETLNKALDIFLQEPQKDRIQAIIIGTMAPTTSHEAAVFRGATKPVVFTQNLENIKKIFDSQKNSLLLDVQRGLLIPFIQAEKFEEPQDTIINNAWYAHPIAPKVSLYKPFIKPITREQFTKLQPREYFSGITTTALINMIKNEAPEQANKALVSLLHRLTAAIKMQAQLRDKKLLKDMRDLLMHLYQAVIETQVALNQWQSSAKTATNRLERLYPIVFLEALVRQTPYIHEFVNDYSVATLLKIEKEEEALIPAVSRVQEQEYAVQFLKVGNSSFTPEVKESWNQLVEFVTAQSDRIQPFARMIYTYAQMGLLSPWINSSFAQVAPDKDPEKVFNNIIKEFDESKDILKIIQDKKEFLNNFAVNLFEEPSLFTKQFSLFENEVLKFCQSSSFVEEFEKASLVSKLAFIDLMKNVVDIFDIAIKTLKSSTLYSNQQLLTERFKAMVKEYFILFKSWAYIPTITALLKQAHDTQKGDFAVLKFDDYIPAVEKIINDIQAGIDQMVPSQEFNVAGAMLASGASWVRSKGSHPTLEDMFTLAHQNLLLIIGFLTKVTVLESLSIPEDFKEVVSIFESLQQSFRNLTIKASLIAISLDQELTFYFNVPLRNHSSTFELIYDNRNKHTIFNAQFIGEARERWALFIDLVILAAQASGIALYKKPILNPKTGLLQFSLIIRNKQEAEFIKKLYIELCRASLTAFTSPIWMLKQFVTSDALIDAMLQLLPSNPHLMLSILDLLTLKEEAFKDRRIKLIFGHLSTLFKSNNDAIIKLFLDKLYEVQEPLPYLEIFQALIVLAQRDEFVIAVQSYQLFSRFLNNLKTFKSSDMEEVQKILTVFLTHIVNEKDEVRYALAGEIFPHLILYDPMQKLISLAQVWIHDIKNKSQSIYFFDTMVIAGYLETIKSLVDIDAYPLEEAYLAAITFVKQKSVIDHALGILNVLLNKGYDRKVIFTFLQKFLKTNSYTDELRPLLRFYANLDEYKKELFEMLIVLLTGDNYGAQTLAENILDLWFLIKNIDTAMKEKLENLSCAEDNTICKSIKEKAQRYTPE